LKFEIIRNINELRISRSEVLANLGDEEAEDRYKGCCGRRHDTRCRYCRIGDALVKLLKMKKRAPPGLQWGIFKNRFEELMYF